MYLSSKTLLKINNKNGKEDIQRIKPMNCN